MPRRRRKGRGKKSMNVSMEESEDDSSLQLEEKEIKSDISSEDLLKMNEADKANISLNKDIEKTQKDVRRSSRISQKIKPEQQDVEKVEPITTALETCVVPENDKKTVTENQFILDNLLKITNQDENNSICETKAHLLSGKELTEKVENVDVYEENKPKVTKTESDSLIISKTVEDQMEIDYQITHTPLQSLENNNSTSASSKCEDKLQQNFETVSSNLNLKDATIIIEKLKNEMDDNSCSSLSNIDKREMRVEASNAPKIEVEETVMMDFTAIIPPTVQDSKAELCSVNAPPLMEHYEKSNTDNTKVVSSLELDSKVKSSVESCIKMLKTEDLDTEPSVSNNENSKQNLDNILDNAKVNLHKGISNSKEQANNESNNESECKSETVILSNINLTLAVQPEVESTNTNKDSNDATKGQIAKMVYNAEQSHKESKKNIVTDKATSNLSKEPPAKKLETASQEGMKEKQNRIPGRSFIIGIKNPLKGKNILFDCVLCFGTKRTPVPGPRIHSHIKSREHTLKVMEIENSSLYDLYKKDSITPTDRLITLLVDFEATQAKQALVLANPENYVEKRKAVQKKISLLRQLVSKKCDNSSTKTETKHVNIGEETNQKASNITGFISSALSSKRFDKVVILVNQIYESVLQHFAGPQVLIIADENLKFSNIANFIAEKSETMPSRILWLTLIGTYCMFQVDKRPGCILEECQNPLYTLTPSADILELTSAFNTVNKIRMSCIALMSEIRSQLGPESTFFMLPPFPPTIYIESKFLHSSLHSLQTDNMEIYIASEEWIDHFNIVFTYFSKEMTSLFIEELSRMNYSEKVFEYKTNLSDKQIHVVHHLDESKSIPLDSWKAAMFKLIFELLNGHISSALSSKRFDKVVILVNQIYESVLQHFAGPQVFIIADENLKFSNIANFIAEKSETMPSRILWLTLIGTYCIFQVDKRPGCILEECQNPLYSLTPSADISELTSALDTVNKIRMSCIALMSEIRSQLGPESTFFMLPPFPPTIYIESKFLHSTLHSLQTDSMEIYIASEEWIDHFNIVFTYFSKEMTSLFIEELSRMNYSQKTVFEYRANLSDKYIHIVRHLDESKTSSLDSWKAAMFKLIFELLNGHDIIPDAEKQMDVSIPGRIGSLDRTNMEHSFEANLPATAAIGTSSSEHYDHLAFIGFPEQLHQLSTTGKSNISLWNLKFPLDWADMKTKFASLESLSKKKKLFVILVDISLIAIEVFDSQCQVEQCKQKISYLTAGTSSFNALIEEKIDCINRLASKVNNHFGSNSRVILAPICSRYCIEKPITIDQKSHANLHDALKHECRPCILEAPQSIWEDAVQKFEKMWKKEVSATLGASDIEILKLIEKYKRKPQSLLEWRKPDRSSLSSKSLYNSCKLFFTELIQTVLPASKAQQKLVQVKQQKQESSHTAQVPVVSKMKESSSSYTNSTKAYSQMSRILLPVQIKSYPPPPIGIQQQPGNFVPPPYNPDVYRMNTPYQMQQQPPSYSNTPYNQDVYGMNASYQPQHQNYMGTNMPFSQPQIPYSNFQVPPPTAPYSSQVTYQSCAITYSQTPKNPAPIQQNLSQPECSLVKIPLNVSSEPEKTSPPQQVIMSSMEKEATEAFTESLKSFFPTGGSVESNFDNAFIIGNKKIIQPMSEIKLKNTTLINYNLSSVLEKDVPVLLAKIGTITKKSVCFLAFSLPVITKIVPVSPSCSKFACKQPIPISNLKSSETRDFQSNPTVAIVKRIKELVTFVTNLAKFLPVIVLPLFPSRVFCDDASVISKHRISHAIASRACYVVLGTKEVWETHLCLFTQLWNNFLEANHKKYISSDLITKYTEVQKNSLVIKEHVNDFFTDYSEPTLWRAFLQTLMQVLMGYVENISGSNLLSAINPKTRVPKKTKENVKKLPSKNTSMSVELSSSLKTSLPQVKVWSLSSSIPDDFFFNLFKTVEPASLTEKHEDKFLIYMTRSSAILVVQKLNNCQLGDTTLKACITGAEEEPITLDTVQNNYINALFNQIYDKWRGVIIDRIKESLDQEFEIINYKIQRCGRICTEVDKCLFYHNELDRRRSLNVYNYTQKMCPFPKVSVGACASGDACSFSHNIYEQMFFPTNFQTILCPTLKGQKCLKLPFCKFAHKGTPEMFYMGDWQDLVTFGTRSAFTFFAGAIKGMSKLSSKKDVKVCLISPSQELLEAAKSAVFSILKIHKLKAILLTKKWVNPESYNVFLGTPSTIAKFHGQLLSTKASGAFIVDGINHILDSSSDRESLLKICQKLKITTNRMSPINKVFVVSHYDSKITGIISRFLGLSQLIEVEQTEESVRLPVAQFAACSGIQPHKEMKPDRNENVSFQVKQNDQKAFQAGVSREGKRPASRSHRKDRDRSCFTSHQKKHDSHRHKQSLRQSRRSRSRSPSRKRKGRSRSRTRRKSPSSRRRRSLSKSNSSKKRRYSEDKESKTRTQPTSHHKASSDKSGSWEEPKLNVESSVQPDQDSLRQKLGEDLYAEFVRAEEAAQKAHEEDFNSSYSTKMYGEYREYYLQCEEEFYRKFGSNREGAHWEELWKGYWQSKLLNIKRMDWEKKREELKSEFERKANFARCPNKEKLDLPSTSVFVAEKFSVEGTLNLLQELSGHLGMLGPAVVAIVQSAKDLGTTTNKALAIFTDDENVVLIKMVLEKIRILGNSASEYLAQIATRTIDWTNQLLDYAKSPSKEKDIGLNLEAIAKASVGKDSTFVLSLIKTALAYEGVPSLSKEEINDIFMKVCSMHFDMAMKG